MAAKGARAGATANPAAAAGQGAPAPTTVGFDDDATASPAARVAAASRPGSGGSSGAQNGAGILLGFVLWVWVALPYLDGGRERVAAVLRAKLTNKAADGSPLP